MAGSIAPGPSAGVGRRRRGVRTRLWLLMAISWVWVGRGSDRAAGTGPLSYESVICPKCLELNKTMRNGSPVRAIKMKDGSYRCRNRHRFPANPAQR